MVGKDAEAPMKRNLSSVWGVAVVALLAYGFADGAPVPEEGVMLGPSNWQIAEGLLPDEILEHYRNGEYMNRIVDIERPGYLSLDFPPDFRNATLANRGRYELSEENSILDRETGEQPKHIFGLPFPDIDPSDPRAGVKIVWNYCYANWYNGDEYFLSELVMLNRSGVERRIRIEIRTRMYDGAPEALGRRNPDNLLAQRLARVVHPVDLAGTTSLTWRFRDGDKHDSQWSYVPGLRRVRQVSALNRSDGFLGSDISLDDGPFFDGKAEDFDFRLLEQREQLVFIDPYSVRGEAEIVAPREGGWRIVWKGVPRIGADMPDWSGVPWAPVSTILVRRPVWIVEAIPKDPNYLYGRLVLRFDAETYHGSFVVKYDRAGDPMMSYQASYGAYYSVDGGKSHIAAGGTAVRTAENYLYDRATVILFPPRNPRNPADYRVDNPADLFSIDALLRFGK
jgi:hypothetical protein